MSHPQHQLQHLFEAVVTTQVKEYDAEAKPSFVNGTLFVEFVADDVFSAESKAYQILNELRCLNHRVEIAGPIGNEYAYDFVA
jgi:hypothetical protein